MYYVLNTHAYLYLTVLYPVLQIADITSNQSFN